MRAVLCVDVEPDLRQSEYPGPAKWDGADLALRDHAWLRTAMSAPGDERPAINWFVRIDPQVELSNGSPTWAAERYADSFAGLALRGDEVGLHPHNWRWCADENRWVSDGSDAWVETIVQTAIEGFEKAIGHRCRSYRHGDRFVSDVIVRTLLADPDVLVDLTLEPGTPAARCLVASEHAIGLTRHVDLGLSRRFQPADDTIDIPVPPDGRLTMVPLTTGVVPGGREPETLQLWRDPDQFQRMLRLRLLDADLDHLAFAVRTDVVLIPWARTYIERNLQCVRNSAPMVTWVAASSMALEPADDVERAIGLAGGMALELDRVTERLTVHGVRSGPSGVSGAVDRLLHHADAAARDAAQLRLANDELHAELKSCHAEQQELRADLVASTRRGDMLASRIDAVEGELDAIRRTVTWRAHQQLLPVLRPIARARRRLALVMRRAER